MSVRDALECAANREEVPADVLERAFGAIADGEAAAAQVAGLLVALRTKGETVGEMVAIARALKARATRVSLAAPRTIDMCGTGGSGLDTFSISTTASFVVAGAGVPVAKHGNRAATSRTGSFDTFEALGVRIDLPLDAYVPILARVGIAPFFARTAHPAMRFLAPVRQELGIRTVINNVAPLLNPMGVRRQLVGTSSPELVVPLAEALGALGADAALVVHGSDGLDELTTTGTSAAARYCGGAVERLEVDPVALGLPLAEPAALCGGDAAENAAILRGILEGEPGPRRDIVLLNAAAALWTAAAAADLREGLEVARESIDSGAALRALDALVQATRDAA